MGCRTLLECRSDAGHVIVVRHLTAERVAEYCVLLEINRGASPEAITRAFRARTTEYEADKVAALGRELREFAARKRREIDEAYEALLGIASLRARRAQPYTPRENGVGPSQRAAVATQWFVSRRGATVGPVSHQQIVDWIRVGMTDGHVRTEGGSHWMLLSESPFAGYVLTYVQVSQNHRVRDVGMTSSSVLTKVAFASLGALLGAFYGYQSDQENLKDLPPASAQRQRAEANPIAAGCGAALGGGGMGALFGFAVGGLLARRSTKPLWNRR
jgi:hypothetical protein